MDRLLNVTVAGKHMRKISALFATAILILGTSAAAYADVPGSDWISKDKAIASLTKAGFAHATLEADDGHWEGEATKGGTVYEVHVDAHTGAVTKQEPKH